MSPSRPTSGRLDARVGSSSATQLIPRSRRCADSGPPPSRPVAPPPARRHRFRLSAALRIEVVAIGVSTGGPNALAELFRSFPPIPVPIVIVQHMPPIFTRLLAERLTAQSAIPVHEARPAASRAWAAWIAPATSTWSSARDGTQCACRSHQEPPENSCRPSVDVLFRSGGPGFRRHTPDRGHDRHGAGRPARLRVHPRGGGQILVQDEATRWSGACPATWPGGLADRVLPLALLAG